MSERKSRAKQTPRKRPPRKTAREPLTTVIEDAEYWATSLITVCRRLQSLDSESDRSAAQEEELAELHSVAESALKKLCESRLREHVAKAKRDVGYGHGYSQFRNWFQDLKRKKKVDDPDRPLGDGVPDHYQDLAKRVLTSGPKKLTPAQAADQAVALWFSRAEDVAIRLAPRQTEPIRRAKLRYSSRRRAQSEEQAKLKRKARKRPGSRRT